MSGIVVGVKASMSPGRPGTAAEMRRGAGRWQRRVERSWG